MKQLFMLSSGFERSGGATRVIQFAAVSAGMGNHVDLFLIDDGIVWGQIGMAEGISTSTGEHMKELLEQLVEKKCVIHVCKACADRRLISPEELIPGARISTSMELVKMMSDPDYKVFPF